MKVVAFVGPSGTGKSHRAIGIAHKNNCDAIIDDGLLIKGTKILAGTSAKNETNRIQAVKRAIFTEEDHAEAVRQALAGNDVRRLLILATSDNMIEKIVKRWSYLSLKRPFIFSRLRPSRRSKRRNRPGCATASILFRYRLSS